MRSTWTTERDAELLALHDDGLGTATIAVRLGVATATVLRRLIALGRPSDRRWTPAADAVLRRMYPTHTKYQIAAALGVPAFRVANRVTALGLEKQPQWPPAVIRRVTALNAAGECDREIRDAMPGVFKGGLRGFCQVKAIRRTRGLPYRRDADAKRRSVESQRKRLGIRHGGDLRALGFARFAERCGWPADLPPRCVQVLNVLAERGPMTALQLAAAIGASTDKRNSVHGGLRLLACRSSICRGHSTYTGLLKARGFIQAARVSGGPGSGRGGGNRGSVYSVTLYAITTRQRILDERQQQRDGERGAGAGPPAQGGHHPAGERADPAAGRGGGGVRRGGP